MDSEILILTGSPGSGKTTTAFVLAALAGSPKAHLEADAFWHALGHGAIEPWRPQAQGQNATAIRAVAAAAQAYAHGGLFVIIDGFIGPWFLEAFRALHVPCHYVVLQPPLALAQQRCAARSGRELRDPGIIADLHGQLADLGPLQHHILKTGEMDTAAMVDAIVAAVRAGTFRLR